MPESKSVTLDVPLELLDKLDALKTRLQERGLRGSRSDVIRMLLERALSDPELEASVSGPSD